MIYKKTLKYILIKYNKFFRPKALKDFSDFSFGEIGGYVKSYCNLSQKYYFAGMLKSGKFYNFWRYSEDTEINKITNNDI